MDALVDAGQYLLPVGRYVDADRWNIDIQGPATAAIVVEKDQIAYHDQHDRQNYPDDHATGATTIAVNDNCFTFYGGHFLFSKIVRERTGDRPSGSRTTAHLPPAPGERLVRRQT